MPNFLQEETTMRSDMKSALPLRHMPMPYAKPQVWTGAFYLDMTPAFLNPTPPPPPLQSYNFVFVRVNVEIWLFYQDKKSCSQ